MIYLSHCNQALPASFCHG